MERRNIVFVLLFFFTIQSCVKDTCNAELGNTFRSVEIDTIFQNDTNQAVIHLNIETLDELPEHYFSDIHQNDEANLITIDSSSFNKTRISLYVNQFMVPGDDQSSTIHTTHTFPDRKPYISCQHPGSSDQYILQLSFELRKPYTDLEITNFFWDELFIAGHL